MSTSKLILLVIVSILPGCDDVPTPPVVPHQTIELAPGMANLLPHQQEGTRYPIRVLVTASGRPAEGVQVFWDDGRYPSNLSASKSKTSADGIAEVTWILPFIPSSLPWATYHAQASLPGASGNPVDFSIEVYRCTRC